MLKPLTVLILSFAVATPALAASAQSDGQRSLNNGTGEITFVTTTLASREGEQTIATGAGRLHLSSTGQRQLYVEQYRQGYGLVIPGLYRYWASGDFGKTWSGPVDIAQSAASEADISSRNFYASPDLSRLTVVLRKWTGAEHRLQTWRSVDFGATWKESDEPSGAGGVRVLAANGQAEAWIYRGGGAPENSTMAVSVRTSPDGQWLTQQANSTFNVVWPDESRPGKGGLLVSDDATYLEAWRNGDLENGIFSVASVDGGRSWYSVPMRKWDLGALTPSRQTCSNGQKQLRLVAAERSGQSLAAGLSANFGRTWSVDVPLTAPGARERSGALLLNEACQGAVTSLGLVSWLNDIDTMDWSPFRPSPFPEDSYPTFKLSQTGVLLAVASTTIAPDRTKGIYVSVSRNGGATWTTPLRITGPLDPSNLETVEISADGTTALVSWVKNETRQMTTLTLGKSQPPAAEGTIVLKQRVVNSPKGRAVVLSGTAEDIAPKTKLRVMVKARGESSYRPSRTVTTNAAGKFKVKLPLPTSSYFYVRTAAGVMSNSVYAQ